MRTILRLPIKLNGRKKDYSYEESRFVCSVFDGFYPISLDNSYNIVSRFGKINDRMFIFDKNKVEISLDDESLLTILYTQAGKRRTESRKLAEEVVRRNSDIKSLIKSLLDGSCNAELVDDLLYLPIYSLHLASLALEGKQKIVKCKLTGASMLLDYSSFNVYSYCKSAVLLKLLRNLRYLSDSVMVEGERVVLNVSDSNLDILKRVVNSISPQLSFNLIVNEYERIHLIS